MVPISPRKQLAGVIGAVAFGYALSWALTPGLGTGPVDDFEPTFGQSIAPVIVAPEVPRERPQTTFQKNEKELSKPLQKDKPEPI